MPYIITIDAPENQGENLSRIAVATLDEARAAAKDALPATANLSRHFECEDLPETGGTVGPMPDGTVIEVRHVDWIAMRKLAGSLPVRTHDKPAVLEAFNAEAVR